MASRDVRVRVRPTVVRVRISESAVRTVVRVAAENPQLSYPYAYLREIPQAFSLSCLLRAKIAWGIEPQDDLRSPASKHYEFISYFSVASAVLVTFLTLP